MINNFVSNLPILPISIASSCFDPSHWIFIDSVSTVVLFSLYHTVSRSASFIDGTSSITSVGVIG